MSNIFIRVIKKIYRNESNTLIQNINYDLCDSQKRILISYISSNHHTNYITDSIYSSNKLEINQILKFFIDNDYVIDVIHCNDMKSFSAISHNKYDYVFGFGKVFESAKVSENGLRILYLTENHPDFSYSQEKARCDYYKERRGKNASMQRSFTYYNDAQFRIADSIIYLGRDDFLSQYNVEKYWISPSGLKNNNYKYQKRDFNKSKRNFLWFGSRGAVHKGLDILIDVFKKREDITLHICGLKANEEKLVGLVDRDNIINHGLVDVQSDKYLNLVNMCSFLVLPSCSEASSTSMLTCMRHSLIPIRVANTDTDAYNDLIILVKDFSVEEIDEKLTHLSRSDEAFLNEMHHKVYMQSNRRATIEQFSLNFKVIMNKIIEEALSK